MSYNSILVHLDVDYPSDSRLRYATELAGELDAYLIGFAACCVRPVYPTEGWMPMDDMSGLQAKQNSKQLAELKEQFFSIAGDEQNSSWRQSEDRPLDALIANARAADLVISGSPQGASSGDPYRTVSSGDLVTACGRPVMFLAEDANYKYPDKVIVGWKDTPESRRAVVAALPILHLARQVIVATATESKNDHPDKVLADVAAFLMRHGIDARPNVIESVDAAQGFQEFVKDENAEIVVMGAFGHSRIRELVFGGFTRALLNNERSNRLMSG